MPRPRSGRSRKPPAPTSPRSATTSATRPGLYRAVFCGRPRRRVTQAAAGDGHAGQRSRSSTACSSICSSRCAAGQARVLDQAASARDARAQAGLWREKVDRGMQPMHAALVALLCEQLGIGRPTTRSRPWRSMVIAPAVHLLVNCEVVDALAPQLLAGAAGGRRLAPAPAARRTSVIEASASGAVPAAPQRRAGPAPTSSGSRRNPTGPSKLSPRSSTRSKA